MTDLTRLDQATAMGSKARRELINGQFVGACVSGSVDDALEAIALGAEVWQVKDYGDGTSTNTGILAVIHRSQAVLELMLAALVARPDFQQLVDEMKAYALTWDKPDAFSVIENFEMRHALPSVVEEPRARKGGRL